LVKACWIAFLRKPLRVCLFVVLLLPSITEANENSSDVSNDVSVFPVSNWSYAYLDGSDTLMHIMINKKELLWNPNTLQLFVWQPKMNLLPKADLSLGVPLPGGLLIPPSQKGGATTIASQAKVWPDNEMFIHYYDGNLTRLSWSDYFEFRGLDGKVQDFFIVSVEKKGTYIASRLEYQGDGSTTRTVEMLTQDLGPGRVDAVLKLNRGGILLSIPQQEVFPCVNSCSYMVEFNRLPNLPLSIDNRIFLIPYGLMEAALDRAGPALRARYETVRRLISLAKPALLTTIGGFAPPGKPIAH